MADSDEDANVFRVRRRPIVVELRGLAAKSETGPVVQGRMAKKTRIIDPDKPVARIGKIPPTRLIWRVALQPGVNPQPVRAKVAELSDQLLALDRSMGGDDALGALIQEGPGVGEAIEIWLHSRGGPEIDERLKLLAPVLSRMALAAFGPNRSRVRVLSADDPNVTLLDIAA
jgi:hypothetical protein